MPKRLIQALLPSPADAVFIGTLFFVLWFGQFLSNRDGDLGFHITIGRLILSTRSIPTHDVFSYTRYGEPFVPQEWLSEVIFAATYEIGGFGGVALLTATMIGLTFAGLVRVMLRRGLSPLVVLPLTGLGVVASMAHWATRPHVFTFVLTFVWATALEEYRRGGGGMRRLWWLLPLMLLWVNLHGAFVFGDILTMTYLAGAIVMWLVSGGTRRATYARQVRDLTILLVGSLLISGLNPRGFDLLLNNTGFFRNAVQFTMTPEWQSPDFHNPLFYPMLLVLMLALAVSTRRELTPLLLLASWGAFSLYSFRNLAQFIIICLPLMAESAEMLLRGTVADVMGQERVPAWLDRGIRKIRQLDAGIRAGIALPTGGIPALLAIVAVAWLLSRDVRLDFGQSGYGFSERSFPIAAIEHVRPFPPGQRVFNDAQWGGYLNFCCWPAVRNFFDGRIDFYEVDHIRDYQIVQDAEPGWQEVLDRYQVDWVMVFSDRPLVPWLDRDSAWRRIYADETAVIFVRN